MKPFRRLLLVCADWNAGAAPHVLSRASKRPGDRFGGACVCVCVFVFVFPCLCFALPFRGGVLQTVVACVYVFLFLFCLCFVFLFTLVRFLFSRQFSLCGPSVDSPRRFSSTVGGSDGDVWVASLFESFHPFLGTDRFRVGVFHGLIRQHSSNVNVSAGVDKAGKQASLRFFVGVDKPDKKAAVHVSFGWYVLPQRQPQRLSNLHHISRWYCRFVLWLCSTSNARTR